MIQHCIREPAEARCAEPRLNLVKAKSYKQFYGVTFDNQDMTSATGRFPWWWFSSGAKSAGLLMRPVLAGTVG